MSGRAERVMAELDSPLAFTSAEMLETEFDELRLFPSVSGAMQRCSNDKFSECQRVQTMRRP